MPAIGGEGGAVSLLAPSLTSLRPSMVRVGAEVQVLAPLGEDRDLGGGASSVGLAGLRRTLAWTEAPRRLKPAHLAYTARAALKYADRVAVSEMMERASGPDYRTVTARGYVGMVSGWRTMRVVAEGVLAWRIVDRGDLQTVRVDAADDLSLDLAASSGVLGARRTNGALYVALDPAEAAPLVTLVRDGAASGVVHPVGAPALAETGFDVAALARDGCRLRADVSGRGSGRMTWWTLPHAAVQASLSREGIVRTTIEATADAEGRAVLDIDALPGGFAELVLQASCGEG